MQRAGANLQDMQMSDFLCDFCRREWDGAFPMVEGHQGSLICGDCLAIAWTEVELMGQDLGSKGTTCTMCLEVHDDRRAWVSPMHEEAVICHRCIKQGAGRLHKDPDWEWRKPELRGE